MWRIIYVNPVVNWIEGTHTLSDLYKWSGIIMVMLIRYLFTSLHAFEANLNKKIIDMKPMGTHTCSASKSQVWSVWLCLFDTC